MTLHQTNRGYEPNVSVNANVSVNTTNREMDTSGARSVPTVDLTHDDDDTNSLHIDVFPEPILSSADVVQRILDFVIA